MVRGGHAIRLGMRAATRNPELALGKTLLDAASAALALVPLALAAVLAFAAARSFRDPLVGAIDAIAALHAARWSTIGAIACAAAMIALASIP